MHEPWEIPSPLPPEFDLDDFITSKSSMTRAICKEMLMPTALTGIHKTVIDRCVKEWYHKIFSRKKPQSETLIELREYIGRQEEPEAREIYLALEMFTHGSLNAFAGQSNETINNRLVTIGLKISEKICAVSQHSYPVRSYDPGSNTTSKALQEKKEKETDCYKCSGR